MTVYSAVDVPEATVAAAAVVESAVTASGQTALGQYWPMWPEQVRIDLFRPIGPRKVRPVGPMCCSVVGIGVCCFHDFVRLTEH